MQVTSRLFSDYIKPIPTVATDVLGEVEGLDKSFKFVKSILDLHTALTPYVSESLEILGTAIKGCSEVMIPFQFFKVIKMWVEVKDKSKAGVAALVNITVLTTLGLTKFLAKLKLFDLAALTQKIGAIPVLGTIIQIPLGVFVIGANGFSLIDTRKNLNKNTTKLQAAQIKFNSWKARCTLWDSNKTETDLKKQVESLNDQLTTAYGNPLPADARQQMKLDLFVQSCNSVATRSSTTTPTTSFNAARAYLEFKFNKHQTNVINLKVERSKFKFSILANITIIAVSILGLVGTTFGIAALAATSTPMLVLGVIVATVAIGKIIYDKSHKTQKVAPKLKELQDEIWKEYKHNKNINGIKKKKLILP